MREGYPPFDDHAGWSTTTLGAECSFITKGTTPTTCGFGWKKTGIPFLRSECVGEDGFTEQGMMFIGADAHRALSRSEVRKGDILVTITGNVGRIAVFPYNEGNINQHIARVRLESGSQIDAKYLRHVLSTQEYRAYFNNIVTGLAYPQISLVQVREARVYVPPMDEQRRIAAILDTSEAAIRTSEAVIEKLRLEKRGVIVSGYMGGTYRRRTLSEISHFITSGSRGWGSYYSETGAIFLRVGNLRRDHINFRFDSLVRVRPPKTSEGNRTRIESGDVLISITADLGMIGVIPEDFEEAYVNQHIALLRPKRELVNPQWLGYALLAPVGASQFFLLNDAGAKAGLNLPTVGKISLPVPSLSEQHKIAQSLLSFDETIAGEERQLAKLRLQHQGLLHDLLTGRTRTVREASA